MSNDNAPDLVMQRDELEKMIAEKEVELHEMKVRLLQTNNSIAEARVAAVRAAAKPKPAP